jgi:uncharacterized protein
MDSQVTMEKNYRRCVSCRRVAPKSDFWRLVRLAAAGIPDRRTPPIVVVLDQGMGRSAYLCRCDDCLKAAQKKDRLSRALKAPIDPALYEQLKQRLGKDSTLNSF